MCRRASCVVTLPGRTAVTVLFATCALVASPADIPPGTVLWHVAGEGKGTPVADGASVYFLSGRHEVVAVDASLGIQKWRRALAGQGPLTDGVSLLIAGPLVIAGDYDLFALNREDGAVAWRFTPSEGYGPGIYLGEAARGLAFAGSPAARLYAIEQDTGKLKWCVSISDSRADVFEPVAIGTSVYAGYTIFGVPNIAGVIAVDSDTGNEIWRTSFAGSATHGAAARFSGGLAVHADLLLAAAADGTIYGIASADGAVRWTISGLSTVRSDYRALVTSGSHLIAGSLSGVLVCYDLANLHEKWRVTDDGISIGFRLAADSQTVFVTYLSGQLAAFDVTSGKRLWSIGHDESRMIGSPFVLGDRIFVNGSTGFYSVRR